ncbi:hypothetical protein HHS_07480 [Candidatus Pantoea carbekii]|uniref:Uncharacterized protein n=1 Tax=Candidatus Pantoea carbekii TaxID=1235990 RepID=U3U9T3_9GAMM|nr:hypothetical protein HHS_07480 [Candidatus Pantoea carbekii]
MLLLDAVVHTCIDIYNYYSKYYTQYKVNLPKSHKSNTDFKNRHLAIIIKIISIEW